MVRPVELQDVFAKTQAAERVADTQRAQPENDQRQAAETGQRQSEVARRKPVPPPKSDEVILHREAPKKDQEKKKNAHNAPADSPEDEESDETHAADGHETTNGDYDEDEPPHSIDVTV